MADNQQYDNTNKGTLSINDRRRNDRDPTHSGKINIDGKEYWLSGWEKTAQRGQNAGSTFISLSVKPKEAAPAPYADAAARKPAFRRDPAPTQAPKQAAPRPVETKDDDPLPF